MASQKNFTYPQAPKDDTTDDFHGTLVPDPFRPLEDPESEETLKWVTAQNILTADFIAEIPARPIIHQRLTKLWNYPKFTVPRKKGQSYFHQKNDGLQNQAVLYKQNGLDDQPQQLLDPNTITDDGTVALIDTNFSKDGSLMAYVIAASGSDWQEIHIRNTETGQDFDDVLQWCKFSGIAWKSDNSGFFYNRYPAPDTVEATKRGNSDNAVYWHKVGTPQSDDVLVYSSPDDPELAFAPFATDDKEYLCLYVWHGAINRNRIYYRSLDSDDDFIRLLDDADAEYDFVGNDGRNFYVKTDLEASHGRIIAIDLDNPSPENWRTIIPEQDDTIMFSSIINNQLVLIYMHNAYNLVKIYDLDGSFIRDVPLPGIGSIVEFSGSQNDTEMFLHFTSYLYAPTIFRYDFAAHTLTTWKESGIDFPVDEYETEQVFYESKDGTKVSMFITHKKDMPLDGNNPTILYGYGGYSISLTPEFHPQILSWLALGGVYVVANLRGGAEYGEDWHQAGMLENKQNVFDDFIAAGEWLVENRYTSAKKLAIMGGSNGGLLVSVCMIQRPDLFGAVICRVPVTDMLRYHKFTAGRFWTPEYGNAEENPEHFAFMYNYSPLHNVKQDETYPPLLITTADHDDRVVPLHSKKFAATIQEADSGQNPLLLRLDMKAGHGLGKPTTKQIDELTDIHAFLVRTLEIQ